MSQRSGGAGPAGAAARASSSTAATASMLEEERMKKPEAGGAPVATRRAGQRAALIGTDPAPSWRARECSFLALLRLGARVAWHVPLAVRHPPHGPQLLPQAVLAAGERLHLFVEPP